MAAARDVDSRKALMAERIVETATQLFAERGFAGTTLADIAAANGLTRSAMYHYFPNKEAILARLVSAATDAAAGDLREIRARGNESVAGRLRAMAESLVLLQARHPDRFKLLVRSEPDLPAELRSSYDSGRRHVLREFTTIMTEGVRSGAFRPVDARTAALGVIGLCNWIAWWHKPADDEADRKVARELADMVLASVLAGDSPRTEGNGVHRSLAALKRDVAELEVLLAREG